MTLVPLSAGTVDDGDDRPPPGRQEYLPSMMHNGGADSFPLPDSTMALGADKLHPSGSHGGNLLLPPGWNKAFYAYQPPPPMTSSEQMAQSQHHLSSTGAVAPSTMIPPVRMVPSSSTSSSTTTTMDEDLTQQQQAENTRPQRKRRRPPHSYASMIAQAILTSAEHRLTLREIYEYVQNRYPRMYEANEPGWQNTIRHNLSLNRCFYKQPRTSSEPRTSASGKARGKGGYWCVDIAELSNTTFGSQILASGMLSSVEYWQDRLRRHQHDQPPPQQQQQLKQQQQQLAVLPPPVETMPNISTHPPEQVDHRNFWI